jgi:5,5'-dehydrodivanillate O-demethylase oxygenase subunit
MTLTAAQNERFTRVGRGTPAGQLLRRYWMPVAVATELTPEHPTRFVRVLGEDLVLYLDKSGRVGLIADHCAHRGASLLYGRVEERGIACAYHGWLYDTAGNCLETPAEPADSNFYLTVRIQAYPVQKYVGLYWAYLGPEPTPVLPRYDVWARPDGTHSIQVFPRLDCNWFQAMENSADPAHADVLHHEFHARRGVPISNSTRGNLDDIEAYEFYLNDIGIMKRRISRTAPGDHDHPLIFPNILRVQNCTQVRVPIDDTHTMVYRIVFDATPDGSEPAEDPIPVVYTGSYKQPAEALHPFTKFDMYIEVIGQDHMAWETQGPVADRTNERLTTSDHGIVLLREVMEAELQKVEQGLDPMGVVRDPQHEIIDTNLEKDYVSRFRARGDRYREQEPSPVTHNADGTYAGPGRWAVLPPARQ